MSFGDGLKRRPAADRSIGEIVSEVSEKASMLVREEIELAKAEVSQKASKLAKGAAVAAVAGGIVFFGIFVLLIGLAFFFNDLLNFELIYLGFFVVFGILVLLAAIAGFLAYRWLKGGAPPTPELAIEEARLTREAFEHQAIERDQVGRSLERGEALTKAEA